MICSICNKDFSTKGFGHHIIYSHNISVEEYYTTYIGKPSKCKVCDNDTKFISLAKGYTKYCSSKCRHEDHSNLVIKDITNNRYGLLTVKEIDHKRNGRIYWKCLCDCGNEYVTRADVIAHNPNASCGCLNAEITKNIRIPILLQYTANHIKKNEYDLSGEYGIGYCSNNHKPFYFDLEDYDKIKDYTWYDDPIAKKIKTMTYKSKNNDKAELPEFILDVKNNIQFVGGVESYHDNRKLNLRFADKCQMTWNRGLLSNNTSGCTGVSYVKRQRKWQAQLQHHGIVEKKLFVTKEEAIDQRRKWEDEFYGEYSYLNSKKKYEEN